MSLVTYKEVRPWAKSIREQVQTRAMPPFHASGPIGRYEDDPRLDEQEIRTITNWVESGAKFGNAADLAPPREWESSHWRLGEPDMVLKMPKINIRTDGLDENINLYTQHVFTEDLWINGVEIRSSNPKAMHHALLFITKEDDEIPEELMTRKMKTDLLTYPMLQAWLPGMKPHFFNTLTAKLIPKGRRLFMETHYAPSEEPMTDEALIGLHLADGVVDTIETVTGGLFIGPRTIPPGVPDYRASTTGQFSTDFIVTSFYAHMHLRGKSVKTVFRYPDGRKETVFEVPNYDFYWQRQYHLAEPMRVPKGTVAKYIMTWDNSADNPDNPDPSQAVQWGSRTVDEMGNVTITGILPDKMERPIIVKNGREVNRP